MSRPTAPILSDERYGVVTAVNTREKRESRPRQDSNLRHPVRKPALYFESMSPKTPMNVGLAFLGWTAIRCSISLATDMASRPMQISRERPTTAHRRLPGPTPARGCSSAQSTSFATRGSRVQIRSSTPKKSVGTCPAPKRAAGQLPCCDVGR